MKTAILSAICSLLGTAALSQQINLQSYNRQRLQINRNGMMVLGGWSSAYIIYGTIAASKTSGSTKYFHQMNAIWNGVTLGLVTVSLLTAKKSEDVSLTKALKEQASSEKIFLLNAGLDVAYIAGGLYLKERANSGSAKNPERNKGYGESIMLQGSALLLFDAVMYAIHHKHGKQLYQLTDKLQIAPVGNGVGVRLSL